MSVDDQRVRDEAQWLRAGQRSAYTEEQLAFLATVLANLPDAVISTDSTMHIRSWNPQAEKMYGWTAREVVGRSLDEVCQSRFLDSTPAEAEASFVATGIWEGEIAQRRRNGQTLYVWGKSVAVRDESGAMIGAVTINSDITARKQAELATATSERRFRALIENSGDGIMLLDADRQIAYASPSAARIFGYSPEELLRPDLLVVHPDDCAAIENNWRRVVAAPGEPIDHAYRIQHRDGDWRWIETTTTNLLADPDVRAVVINVRDITVRKQTEQSLAASEARYRQAIRAAGAIPYSLDYATNRYTFIPPEAEQLTGYAFAELTPEVIASLYVRSIPRGQLAGLSIEEAVARARRGEAELWQCDHCMRSRTGEERWVSDNAIQILDEHGLPIGSIGILQDITERHHAEVTLRANEERYRQLAAELEQRVLERTAELQSERDFASQVMDALGQGVVVSDGQHRIDFANPFLARLLGVPTSTVIGSQLGDFIVAEDVPVVEEIARQHRPDEEYQYELRLKTASGQVIPTLVSSSPRWYAGKIVGRIAVVADLTEIKRIETTLRQSRDELRDANLALEKAVRMKDEFLASMSHELRTPLTGILGLSEALQMQNFGVLNERQLRAVDNIWQSGQHLLALINDILDLSRLEAVQFELEIGDCEVGGICRASLALVKGMAHKKQQQLDFVMDPSAIHLRADPRRLKQMLVNLLSNAVKFTPAHGELGLRVNGDAARQIVEFSVWDNGIGIASENVARLFQPFTQLDSGLTREYAGSGLGLALVQRMAQLHNGTIAVISTPGVGSTFTLTLPWRRSEPAGQAPPPAYPTALSNLAAHVNPDAAPVAMRPLLLLADDNMVSADVLAELLTTEGYRVELASNGLEAVEKASALMPALILMDIRMPVLDGFQAIAQIRAHADRVVATVPIIALTAQAMHGDAERCLAAGADAHVAKPFRFADILHTISSQLEHSN